MPQITARLSPTLRQRFEEYALSLGLTGSSLARLLLVRELQATMAGSRVRGRKRESEDGKLTAHSCSDEIVRRLQAYADGKRTSRADAARLIFERELSDRWLARATKLSGSQPRHKKG
jgi:hypothetical protein